MPVAEVVVEPIANPFLGQTKSSNEVRKVNFAEPAKLGFAAATLLLVYSLSGVSISLLDTTGAISLRGISKSKRKKAKLQNKWKRIQHRRKLPVRCTLQSAFNAQGKAPSFVR